jgi:hypothetical protein
LAFGVTEQTGRGLTPLQRHGRHSKQPAPEKVLPLNTDVA